MHSIFLVKNQQLIAKPLSANYLPADPCFPDGLSIRLIGYHSVTMPHNELLIENHINQTLPMKTIEKIILLLLAAGLTTSMHTGSTMAILASAFTLFCGFYFFHLNAIHGIKWLQLKKTATFIYKSALPFLLIYLVAVVLNVFYGLTYTDSNTFKPEYLITPYAHKESALLPVLYASGLFYGYLRTNRKAVVVTLATTGVLIITGLVYVNLPTDTLFKKNNTYQEITQLTTIQELVKAPQFKDKTLYIDLWYSSCSPCIAQFKNHLPDLKREVAENNLEVEYIYLARETSHPDSKQRWTRAIEKYGLKGWHYYFPKEKEQAIWEEIATSSGFGYPHYLIAKKGKILSYQAPLPEAYEEVIQIMQSDQ